MHLAPLIHDLGIITLVAALVTLLFQRIKQPVVLGYIIAGVIVGPYSPSFLGVKDLANIETLAELGVIFLMFNLGLEFSFRKLTKVGTSAGLTAIFEIFFMLGLGIVIGKVLDWNTIDCIFLGAILSISSTTIIIKALDELGLKSKRFAGIIFGILIVEDLIAILLLVALTTIVATGTFSTLVLAASAGKLALVVGSWFLAGYFVVPRFMAYIERFRSDETMTIFSVGLCLGLVIISSSFGYSVALGAFIMGSILAESAEVHRIETLVKPLRDLFAAIFFVSVGMLIDPAAIWNNLGAVAIISFATVAGKLVSVVFGALATGQSIRNSILIGFSLAQIGEFSFIIATLGLSLGVMSPVLYPIAVAVSIVTTFTTPFLIRFAPVAADILEKRLPTSVRIFLERYGMWQERLALQMTRGPDFNRRLFQWFASGFVVTVIFVLMADIGLTVAQAYLSHPYFSVAVGWIAAFLLASPFVWSMFKSFRNYKPGVVPLPVSVQPVQLAPLVINLLSVLWLGVLSLAFFPARYVGILVIASALFFAARLYRQLEASYSWFERWFLFAFQAQAKRKSLFVEPQPQPVPWVGHLVKYHVHPNSEISGKRIDDAALKNRFGLNIVAIKRGALAIVEPGADQMILPDDELLILGTDEQLEQVRPIIEHP